MTHTSRETALELMMDVAPRLRKLLVAVAKHDKHLATDARRAAQSVVSNLGEADGVTRGHRKERLETAKGSLTELRAQLKLALFWAYVAREEVDAVEAILDRATAMTWRRLHPRR